MKRRIPRAVLTSSSMVLAISEAITLKYKDDHIALAYLFDCALIDLYKKANKAEKELINHALIFICDYSIPELIKHARTVKRQTRLEIS